MKLTATTLALLGFMTMYGTTAHADLNEDYNECAKEIRATFPDHKKIKINKSRSRNFELKVQFKDAESIVVKCDRKDYELSLKDGTSLAVASK